MRILFLSNMKKVSGGEIFLERILHELDKKYSFVLSLPEGIFAERSKANGYKIKINQNVGRLNRDQGMPNYAEYLVKLMTWVKTMASFIKEDKIDLIVSSSFGMALHASLVAFITGKDFMWFHMHPILRQGSSNAYMARILALRCSGIACCSYAVKDSLVACGVNPAKIQVTYTGVNTDEYNQEASLLKFYNKENSEHTLLEIYATNKRKLHLALISVIIPWKGHKYLIEAIKLVPEEVRKILSVDIVGSLINESAALLDYKLELEEMVIKYKLEDTISFKGFITDLASYYQDLDIVLNCSQEPEPMGNTILEAMSNSKIAIVTNHGGPLELVDDQVNGFVSLYKDPQSLANIITLICTQVKVHELVLIQEKAKEKAVKYFDIRDTTRKMEQLFDSVKVHAKKP